MILSRKQLLERLNTDNKSEKLVIRPLLSEKQIGDVSIDFRLGYDFLVSVLGREPFINASKNDSKSRPISSFFQETRRSLGETFLLHPNQTILGTSLEYVKLPLNVLAILNLRSSYSRLGLTISTILQPGYCGCISIELTNVNNNPINLTVGAPIFQARFEKIEVEAELNYFNNKRKYVCQVRPMVSSVINDPDLDTLNKIWSRTNKD